MTTHDGDSSNWPLNSTTPHIEEKLVRDGQTNELYLPLTSTVVVKRKQEMLYVPLDFDNDLTKDALVVSGASDGAIVQNELDTIKQEAWNGTFKIDDPPNFQKQEANGQLEKLLETTTLKCDIGDNTFAECFVLMKKLTAPIIGLHFFRNNSVVFDTTHCLTHSPHLTIQNKTTSKKIQNL